MSKAGEFQSSEDEQMKELTEELPLVTKLKKLSSSLITIEVPISSMCALATYLITTHNHITIIIIL